jgi:hypothetical protein
MRCPSAVSRPKPNEGRRSMRGLSDTLNDFGPKGITDHG